LNARNEEEWNNRVIIISSDMRKCNFDEKADIMVSELLGSFGDNELSPECLMGAQHLCKVNIVIWVARIKETSKDLRRKLLQALITCKLLSVFRCFIKEVTDGGLYLEIYTCYEANSCVIRNFVVDFIQKKKKFRPNFFSEISNSL
jgi:hypothetical protein